MKFNITEHGQNVLIDDLVDLCSKYLSEEDKGLFITTTNSRENIKNNIIPILKHLIECEFKNDTVQENR